MENVFIKYIDQGRIKSLSDLKKYYRQIVMRTHPDAIGSDKLVDQYIEYSNFYAEAVDRITKKEIEANKNNKNYRLLFYKEFFKLERIDQPYAFNKHYNTVKEIELTKQKYLFS